MKFIKEATLMILFLTAFLRGQGSEAVREPEVAGMFYPGKAADLSAMINNFLEQTEQVIKGEITGLVSPHAGYVYSGQVAAWSYRQISGKSYDVVIVIAPSHYEYFPGASVFSGKYYQTPLGKIPVDEETAKTIAESNSNIKLSTSGHDPGFSGRGEHSLEVQLPFLQTVLGDFKLVPIVLADQNLSMVEMLGNSLANIFKNKKVLIVASSDLSHYHPYDEAYSMDKSFLDLFEAFQYKEAIKQCEKRKIEACGHGPIATMMHACLKAGYGKSKVIKYATSGDIPGGQKSQVVGYMSGAVYK